MAIDISEDFEKSVTASNDSGAIDISADFAPSASIVSLPSEEPALPAPVSMPSTPAPEKEGRNLSTVERIGRTTLSAIPQVVAQVARVAGDIATIDPGESQNTLDKGYDQPAPVPQGQRTAKGFEQRQKQDTKDAVTELERTNKVDLARTQRKEATVQAGQKASEPLANLALPIADISATLEARLNKATETQASGKRVGWTGISEISSIINDAGSRLLNTPDPETAKKIIDLINKAIVVMQKDQQQAPNKNVMDKIGETLRQSGTVAWQLGETLIGSAPLMVAGGVGGVLRTGKIASVFKGASALTPLVNTASNLSSVTGEITNSVVSDLQAKGMKDEDIPSYVKEISSITPFVSAALDNFELNTLKKAFKRTDSADKVKKILLAGARITEDVGKEGLAETAQGLNSGLASIAVQAKAAEDGKIQGFDADQEIDALYNRLPSDLLQNMAVMAPIVGGTKASGAIFRLGKSRFKGMTKKSPLSQGTGEDVTQDFVNKYDIPIDPEQMSAEDVVVEPVEVNAARERNMGEEVKAKVIPKAQEELETSGERVIYGVPDAVLTSPLSVHAGRNSYPETQTRPNNLTVILKKDVATEADPTVEAVTDFASPAEEINRTKMGEDVDALTKHADGAEVVKGSIQQKLGAIFSQQAEQARDAFGTAEKITTKNPNITYPEAIVGKMHDVINHSILNTLDTHLASLGKRMDKNKAAEMVEAAIQAKDYAGIKDAVISSGFIDPTKTSTIESIAGRFAVIKREAAKKLTGHAATQRDNAIWRGNMDEVAGVVAPQAWIDRNKDKVKTLHDKGITVLATPDATPKSLTDALKTYVMGEEEALSGTTDRTEEVLFSEPSVAREAVEPLRPDMANKPGEGYSPASNVNKGMSSNDAELKAAAMAQSAATKARNKAIADAEAARNKTRIIRPEVEATPITQPVAEEVPNATVQRQEPEVNKQEHIEVSEKRQATETGRGNKPVRSRKVKEEVAPVIAQEPPVSEPQKEPQVQKVTEPSAVPTEKLQPIEKKKPRPTTKNFLEAQKAVKQFASRVASISTARKEEAVSERSVVTVAKRVAESPRTSDKEKQLAVRILEGEETAKATVKEKVKVKAEKAKAKTTAKKTAAKKKTTEKTARPAGERTDKQKEADALADAMDKSRKAYKKLLQGKITPEQYISDIKPLAALRRKYITDLHNAGKISDKTYQAKMAELKSDFMAPLHAEEFAKKHPGLAGVLHLAKKYLLGGATKHDIAIEMKKNGYADIKSLDRFTNSNIAIDLAEFLTSIQDHKDSQTEKSQGKAKTEQKTGKREEPKSSYTPEMDEYSKDLNAKKPLEVLDAVLEDDLKDLSKDVYINPKDIQQMSIKVKKITDQAIKNFLPKFYSNGKLNNIQVAIANKYKVGREEVDLALRGDEAHVILNPINGKVTIVISEKAAEKGDLGRILAHELLGHVGAEYLFRANPHVANIIRNEFKERSKNNTADIKAIRNAYRESIATMTERRAEEFIFSEWVAASLDAWAIGQKSIHPLSNKKKVRYETRAWFAPMPGPNTFLGKVMRSHPKLYTMFAEIGNGIQRKLFNAISGTLHFLTMGKLTGQGDLGRVWLDMVYSNSKRNNKIGVTQIPSRFSTMGTNVLISDPLLAAYNRMGAKINAASTHVEVLSQIDKIYLETVNNQIPKLDKAARISRKIMSEGKQLSDKTVEKYLTYMEDVLPRIDAIVGVISDAIHVCEILRKSTADVSGNPLMYAINNRQMRLEALANSLNGSSFAINQLLDLIKKDRDGDINAQATIIDLERIAHEAQIYDEVVPNALRDRIPFTPKLMNEDKNAPAPIKESNWWEFPWYGVAALKTDIEKALTDKNVWFRKMVESFDPNARNTGADPHAVADVSNQVTSYEISLANTEMYLPAEKILTDAGIDTHLFSQFLTYRSALERNAAIDKKNKLLTGKGSGITNGEAIGFMKRIEKESPAVWAALHEAATYADKMAMDIRENAGLSGVITKEQEDAMAETYPHYVPMKDNVSDGQEGVDDYFGGMQRDFRVSTETLSQHKADFKEARGRFTKPDMTKTWARLREMHSASIHSKNQAKIIHAILNMVRRVSDPKFPMKIVEKFDRRKIVSYIDKASKSERDNGAVDQVKYRTVSVGRTEKKGEFVVTVMEHGKPVTIVVTGPEGLADSFLVSRNPQTGMMVMLANMTRWMTQIISATATRLSLTFPARDYNRNIVWAADNMAIALAKKNGWNPAKQSIEQKKIYAYLAAKTTVALIPAVRYAVAHTGTVLERNIMKGKKRHALSKIDKTFDELRSIGATTELGSTTSVFHQLKNIDREMRYADDGSALSKFLTEIGDKTATAAHLFSSAVGGSDLALRYAMFEYLKSESPETIKYVEGIVRDPIAAASFIQENSMNFGRQGTAHWLTGSMWPFFKVLMQSNYKLIRGMKTSQGRWLAAESVAFGAMFALIGKALMSGGDDEDDDAYFRIPWRHKMAGITIPNPADPDHMMILPMGSNWTVFGSMGQAMLEYAFRVQKDIDDGRDATSSAYQHSWLLGLRFMSAFSNTFNPIGGDIVEGDAITGKTIAMGLLPSVAKQLAEYYSNTKYDGSQIHPTINPNKPLANQYTGNPSELAKWITRSMNGVFNKSDINRGVFDWFTPGQVDYIINAFTTSAGRDFTRLADPVSQLATDQEVDWNAANFPILAAFYKKIPQGEDDNRYMDMVTQTSAAKAKVNAAKDSPFSTQKDAEDIIKAYKWRAAYAGLVVPGVSMKLASNINDAVSNYRKLKEEETVQKGILFSGTTTDAQKQNAKARLAELKIQKGLIIGTMKAGDFELEKQYRLYKDRTGQ